VSPSPQSSHAAPGRNKSLSALGSEHAGSLRAITWTARRLDATLEPGSFKSEALES